MLSGSLRSGASRRPRSRP